jgi:cupin fold WbuC family metalloprotein
VKLITATLLDELAQRAAASPRRRANHNVHEMPADPLQRLFIAAEPDSYFRPHRHHDKTEFAVVLRGVFAVLVFDDDGRLRERCVIGPDEEILAFETPPATWHTLVARSSGAMFFEAKRGPYDPQTAAEFAPWSPAEGTAEAPAFLAKLHALKVGEQLP